MLLAFLVGVTARRKKSGDAVDEKVRKQPEGDSHGRATDDVKRKMRADVDARNADQAGCDPEGDPPFSAEVRMQHGRQPNCNDCVSGDEGLSACRSIAQEHIL